MKKVLLKYCFLLCIPFFISNYSNAARLEVIREDGLFFNHTKGKMMTVITGDHNLANNPQGAGGIEQAAAPYIPVGTHALLSHIFEKTTPTDNSKPTPITVYNPALYNGAFPGNIGQEIVYFQGKYRTTPDAYFVRKYSDTKYKLAGALLPFIPGFTIDGGIIYVVPGNRSHQDYLFTPNRQPLTSYAGDRMFIDDNAALYYWAMVLAQEFNKKTTGPK